MLGNAARQKKKGEFVYNHIIVEQRTESNDADPKEVLVLLIPI